VKRGDKRTKKPLQRIDEPDKWLSVSEACARVARGEADGVGFVLGNNIIGIDLDNCIGCDGTLSPVAQDATNLGTYVERSPGGCGLHVWIKGTIAESHNVGGRNGSPRREIYDGRRGCARYLTVTGDRIGEAAKLRDGATAQAALDAFFAKWFAGSDRRARASAEGEMVGCRLSDDAVLELMFAAKDGLKSRRLFEGDYSEYASQSEADLALCGKLRFFASADPVQMDRLFRRSGLMRPKWDKGRGTQTYGERTTAKALATGGRLYRRPCAPYVAGEFEGRYGKVHESVLPALGRMTKHESFLSKAARVKGIGRVVHG
jgi:putative DNA primase/helicase